MTLAKASVGVVWAGGGTYNIGFNDGDETQFDAYDNVIKLSRTRLT